MESARQAYRHAAVGYFVYGLLYLAGATYLAAMGASERAMGEGSIWWFALGGLMVILLPMLIWKQFKWLTRVLAVLVLLRVGSLFAMMIRGEWDMVPLPWGGEISEGYGAAAFLGISGAACYLLVRAGWTEWLGRRRARVQSEG